MQRIDDAPGDVLQDTTLRSLVLTEQAADTAERGAKAAGK
jgi:hypothetical protein